MSNIDIQIWDDDINIILNDYAISVIQEEININITTETQWPAWLNWAPTLENTEW